MSFHLGKPLLAMLGIALVSGTASMLRPATKPEPGRGLTVWVFADSHARAYRDAPADAPGLSLIEQYRRQTGNPVRVQLISARAEDVRLLSLFYNQSGDVPDLAEIEIASAGKFFRPPVEEVGFLPLNRFLDRDGLHDRILPSRLAPWSKGDVIFGIPHDVHPVTITYRKDLFDQAGVDLAAARTWDDFHELGLRFRDYWHKRGENRYAIALPAGDADRLLVLLLQRRIDLVDHDGTVHINDPKVADTVARYALMVAGPRRIASDETPGGHLWARDLANGNPAALLTADWRVTDLKDEAPGLAGKLAMMPLPVWEPGDAPTTTWGGTMIGIPRRCKDAEESWRLLKWLYFSDEGLRARQRYTDILPALRTGWKQRADERDAFYGGQHIRALFAELAEQTPPRQVTPYTGAAKEALSFVLAHAVAHVEAHGEQGLRQECQRWLDLVADELREMIRWGSVQ